MWELILNYPGQAWQFIVHHSGYMKLKQFDILSNDVSCSSTLLISPQLVVDFYNVSKLVSQVVLLKKERVNADVTICSNTKLNARFGVILLYLVTCRALHDHSWPDGQWRHRKHSYNHPFWSGKLWVHAQNHVLFIRNAFEDLVHSLWAQKDFLLLRVLVNMLPLCI